MHKPLLLLLVLLGGAAVQAEIRDFAHDSQPVDSLSVPWSFHAGDNPSWASPGFDDSSWEKRRLDSPWQAAAGSGDVAWFRVAIQLPAVHPPLALLVSRIDDSYQIFANGRLLGGVGGLPPHAVPYRRQTDNLLLPIPAELVARDGIVVLALRVWHWPGSNHPSPMANNDLLLGDSSFLGLDQTFRSRANSWSLSSARMAGFLSLACGTVTLLLFFYRPREREYLWFSLLSILIAFRYALLLAGGDAGMPVMRYYWLDTLCACIQAPLHILYAYEISRRKSDGLFWVNCAALTLVFLLVPLGASHTGQVYFGVLTIAWDVLLASSIAVTMGRAARHGNSDALLSVVPNTTWILAYGAMRTVALLDVLGYKSIVSRLAWVNQVTDDPFPIPLVHLTQVVMMAPLFLILVLRFARSRRDEERFASEIEAARAVRKVLVPAENPSVPGFAIEAVYRPAGQVGGDFYQVIPTAEGSALIVIGDVSGKGMPAAMTVSLLVGTIRTLARYTQSPSAILCAMNQRMLTRSDGGFTTCLVLRADPGGTLILANAGHLSPYLDGRELTVDTGLPLGISPDSDYPESLLDLPPDSQLTVMTDGVVEARNKAGELFGFERTLGLSSESAERVAQAAQAFGQEDDITVLTLSLAPVARRDEAPAQTSLRLGGAYLHSIRIEESAPGN